MSAPEVGQRLRQARQARNLELEAVAKATRIRSQFLRALEDGEFGMLPSPAQMRGFLRTYAEFLELDPQTLFDLISPKANAQGTGGTQQAMPAAAGEQAVESQAPQIFAELGAQLRQRRESLELTPIEVEENTHIPEHYVLRLEAGGFDSFPSPTQARGMLGNYADFLGLDSDSLLLRYAEALQQRFQAKQAAKPPKPQPRGKPVFRLPPWLTNLFSRDILFGGLAGLLLLFFVVWSIGRIAAAQAGEQPEPTAPPLTGLLLSTPLAPGGSPTTLAGTPGSINLLGGPTTTPGLLGEATIQVGEGAIQLRLISAQRTWLRITVDGEVQFEGRTLPGETYTYNAAGQILLLSGNGAALRGFLNNQDLGILGIYGEVINIVFTHEGAATPTPSPTPTIDSGILTATAGATQTPSATLTPTPVPTENS